MQSVSLRNIALFFYGLANKFVICSRKILQIFVFSIHVKFLSDHTTLKNIYQCISPWRCRLSIFFFSEHTLQNMCMLHAGVSHTLHTLFIPYFYSVFFISVHWQICKVYTSVSHPAGRRYLESVHTSYVEVLVNITVPTMFWKFNSLSVTFSQ